MSVLFSSRIAALVARAQPTTLYSYQPGRLLRFGPWGLSAVFAAYGASFALSSAEATRVIYTEEERERAAEGPWYMAPTLLLFGRGSLSFVLSALPFAVAAAALYVPTRVVLRLDYLPGKVPQCRVTRWGLLGRGRTDVVPLQQLRLRTQRPVYTGVGRQGVEDTATSSFALTNGSAGALQRHYLCSRNGDFWGGDGRVMDALFGGVAPRELDGAEAPKPGSAEAPRPTTAPSAQLEQLLGRADQRAKVSSRAAKNIVRQK
ncbi:AaceriAGL230Cp [[Ashbya] aceris (nom. inval.)]|nr:AaceriAGL230Cp [[Ashbya] aceris (nom. inval.)]